jgi:hypothetical protein
MKKSLILILSAVCIPVFGLFAQKASTSSPYSKFGIGDTRVNQLPQLRAMGGIVSGVRHIGLYSNINVDNPASYSAFQFTVIDAGVNGNIAELSNGTKSETSYNYNLSHVNFGFPLGTAGGISMGVRPFSEVGYNQVIPDRIDTTRVNRGYAGEGGTNAAYIGYGVRLNPNISLGVNFNYVFGKINHIRGIELPDQVGAFNTRENVETFINGFSFGYGAQYFKPLSGGYILVLGYNGALGSNLNADKDVLTVRTNSKLEDGTAYLPIDTISFFEGQNEKINMPFKHSAGFTLSKGNKWMVGADVNYETWSTFKQGSQSQNLRDSYGFAVGAQLTPDPTSVNYLDIVDYRVGFNYKQTPIQIGGEGVDQMAVSFGLGLPLPTMFGFSFNKVNFAAEIGQMGKVSNHLVRERFVNFSLGFTLNDSWFRRPAYD